MIRGLREQPKNFLGVLACAADGAEATPGPAALAGAIADSETPDARLYLAQRTAPPAPAGAIARGRSEAKIAQSDAGLAFPACLDPCSGNEQTMGELPGCSLHGSQPSVDTDQTGARSVRGANPHVVVAVLLDLRPESFFRHAGQGSGVYQGP